MQSQWVKINFVERFSDVHFRFPHDNIFNHWCIIRFF
jgi:hypothetical protein